MNIISRKTAITQGLTFYHTGTPCKRNHVADRYVTNSMCIDCSILYEQSPETKIRKAKYIASSSCIALRKAYNANYYLANSGRIKSLNAAYYKQYYITHKASIKQYSAAHYLANAVKIKLRSSANYAAKSMKIKYQHASWRASNPDVVALLSANRKFKLQRQTPPWSEIELIKQLYCKRDELNIKWNTNFEVDHIIPIDGKTVSGLHVFANLMLLDSSLNGAKGNRYQTDW